VKCLFRGDRTPSYTPFFDDELATSARLRRAACLETAPVFRLNRDTGEREVVLMRWGLIPFWILLVANSAGATEVSENRTFREMRDG
jgi:putative SOS response-associated peptidase YedK